jgi:hypothetical protein
MQAVQLVKGLMNQANLVYDTPIYTITEKPSAPKNESKRYYWSIGPYFWPSQITPENPRGEPYTRRDGVFNAQARHPLQRCPCFSVRVNAMANVQISVTAQASPDVLHVSPAVQHSMCGVAFRPSSHLHLVHV